MKWKIPKENAVFNLSQNEEQTIILSQQLVSDSSENLSNLVFNLQGHFDRPTKLLSKNKWNTALIRLTH